MNIGGLEVISEVLKAAEAPESLESEELLGQRAELQEKLDAAMESNNEEKANFFRGELGRIEEQLAGSGAGQSGEISFGSGHSPEYWYDKAGKEKAEHGETSRYRDFIRYAGEAEADKLKNR